MYKIELSYRSLSKIPGDILKQSGCYILTSKQWTKGLARLAKNDPKSILYIGKADILGRRIESLITSVHANSNHEQDRPNEKGHKSLSRKFYRIRKLIDIDQLSIEVYTFPNIDAKVVESYMLEIYVREFGELPPLNGQFGSHSLYEAITLLSSLGVKNFNFLKAI